MPSPRPVLTLIDASGFVFRAYHAITNLSTSRGIPTNAVYGFTRMLLKTLREMKPTHVALAFDKESRTGRQEIDPTYKANREGPPPDLPHQFELVRQVVDTLRVPVLEFAGWEADDVIGTLTLAAKQQGYDVLIVTGDKDFMQLVDERVSLYDPMNDRHTSPREVRERLGIEPSQMRDYLALIGDPIDNVPKVPGIGPKTATDLIQQFGSVETLLDRLDEVKKPKVREALDQNRDTLRRAKQLVTFRTDLPVETDVSRFVRQPIDGERARTLFTELEFYKLLQEMPPSPDAAAIRPMGKTTVIADREALVGLVEAVRAHGRMALFPAHDGPPATAPLVGLGVAAGDTAGYVSLDHHGLGARRLSREELRSVLGPLLADPRLPKDAHDAKALELLLLGVGVELRGLDGDVELLSYLLNPSRREHALADLARERLHLELPAPYDAAAARRAGSGLSDRPPEEVADAFGQRAQAVERLAPGLWRDIESAKLTGLARELELPLVPVLTRMERHGVKVDLQVLSELSREVDAQCVAQEQELHRLAGRAFNVNSNAQLAQVLYTDLALPVLKKGKTGPSTDAEVLEKLAEKHPLPRALLDYRTLSKLKSTYLDALVPLVKDGRLHTTFHQAATATGRLSSSDPNLQNIPVRTDVGRAIRRAFVADRGWKLISADYSQIELRILAHISEDPGLLAAFQAREDVHQRTAAEVFGVTPGEVTADQRRVAKMVNFGIAYGLSPHGLSTRLDIPHEEAASIIDRYFARYAGIRRYLEETVERARRTGSVETLFGRRRLMDDLHSSNWATAQAAERAAINMPIQGTAADLIKMAMLRIDHRLRESGLRTRMLLQVHDELLFEAPEDEVDRAVDLARSSMMGVAQLRVPLEVEVGLGQSWADAH
ncbi:MAG TPA: DNA polymerase I [Myxococcaceae bacterium]|nr:DNA polymerase I [Myxococcaceae bacterium]